MQLTTRCTVALYVDRATRQWIVRDEEGNFWVLPTTDHPWTQRQPFYPTADNTLESVPGHYKATLGIPIG